MAQTLLGLIGEKKAEYITEQKKEAKERELLQKEAEERRIKDLIDCIKEKILNTVRITGENSITLYAVGSYPLGATQEDLFGDDAVIAHHFRKEGLKVIFFKVPIEHDFEYHVGNIERGGETRIRISWE